MPSINTGPHRLSRLTLPSVRAREFSVQRCFFLFYFLRMEAPHLMLFSLGSPLYKSQECRAYSGLPDSGLSPFLGLRYELQPCISKGCRVWSPTLQRNLLALWIIHTHISQAWRRRETFLSTLWPKLFCP